MSGYAIYYIHLGKIIAIPRDSSDFATNRTKYMGPTIAQEPVGTEQQRNSLTLYCEDFKGEKVPVYNFILDKY